MGYDLKHRILNLVMDCLDKKLIGYMRTSPQTEVYMTREFTIKVTQKPSSDGADGLDLRISGDGIAILYQYPIKNGDGTLMIDNKVVSEQTSPVAAIRRIADAVHNSRTRYQKLEHQH